jgi:hypothetical protein
MPHVVHTAVGRMHASISVLADLIRLDWQPVSHMQLSPLVVSPVAASPQAKAPKGPSGFLMGGLPVQAAGRSMEHHHC